LDRHPELKVLVSEGGATWVPFIGDRMNEGYRQHGMFVRPQLSRLPKEILYRQVYASFQHDESAPAALWAMGYQNVMFGSDYPHLEGTFGHTQKTLHELFDDVAPEVRRRITRGAFEASPRVPATASPERSQRNRSPPRRPRPGSGGLSAGRRPSPPGRVWTSGSRSVSPGRRRWFVPRGWRLGGDPGSIGPHWTARRDTGAGLQVAG
jgi:hypothetical protein